MTDTTFNLRHLMLLAAVVREGSVSAAARAFHLTQPAVTQAILGLEREFSSALFVRSGRGMEPTTAGRLCAGRAGRALERITNMARALVRDPRTAASAVRRMTAAQLGALVATVDAGGFGAAARAAGGTRAGFHRAVRELERDLGVALFETTSHGHRPTREAGRLAQAARLAFAELSQARAEIAAAAGVERGSTVVGAMPLARSAIVPAAVLEFAKRHPRHSVSILDGPYESMLDALRHGRADVLIGALRERQPDDVRQEQLFEDVLAIVARSGHPLSRIPSPGPAQLIRFPWIAPRPGSPLSQHFERLMAAGQAAPPAASIECNSLVAARAILMASDRLMLLSAHQVRYEIAAGELVLMAHPFGRVTRLIGLTTRRDWFPTAAQEELLAAIRVEGARAAASRQPHGSRVRRAREIRAATRPSAG
jgi:DNA-binding transcriptional LysR family regulator